MCTYLDIHRKNVTAFVVNSGVVHAGECMVFMTLGSKLCLFEVNGGVDRSSLLGFES
jgi:hypothetical protein